MVDVNRRASAAGGIWGTTTSPRFHGKRYVGCGGEFRTVFVERNHSPIAGAEPSFRKLVDRHDQRRVGGNGLEKTLVGVVVDLDSILRGGRVRRPAKLRRECFDQPGWRETAEVLGVRVPNGWLYGWRFPDIRNPDDNSHHRCYGGGHREARTCSPPPGYAFGDGAVGEAGVRFEVPDAKRL